MTAAPSSVHPARFVPLEQTAFRGLEHAAYLKGLLKPFTGKGGLETCASQCMALRDGLIALAQRQVLPQAQAYPFNRLGAQLALQATGAGTSFLRWRNPQRSAMGVALWQALLDHPGTAPALRADLYAMELQRIALNLQISLTHAIARQALECARKMGRAEAVYLRRADGQTPIRSTPKD